MAKPLPPIRIGAAVAAVGLALSGCAVLEEPPNVLYLAITTNSDQKIDGEQLLEYRDRLKLLHEGYKQIHPSTKVQFALYPTEKVAAAMARRNRAGLGPDLLMVNGQSALELMEAGLTDPYPADPKLLRQFHPAELARVTDRRGRLAGLPLAKQTQVACFNRKRLKEPPRTTADLLTLSQQDHPIGLSIELHDLFWSAGSLGALAGVNRAIEGQTPTAAELAGITRWLAWLQNANTLQKLTFYPSLEAAESDFMAGRVDWIPCHSTVLPRLQKRLGSDLSVAPLPRGSGGEASPLNRLRLLALGKSSSAAGRQRALSFSRYSVNPLSQRTYSLGSRSLLPANRFVGVPIHNSPALESMVISAQQGQQTNRMVQLLQGNDARLERAQNLITSLVFGEGTPAEASAHLVRILLQQP